MSIDSRFNMPTWPVLLVEKKKYRRLLWCSLGLFFLFFSIHGLKLTPGVKAATDATTSATLRTTNFATDTPIDLSLSPAALSFQTKAGDVSHTQIKIRNNGNIPEQLSIQIGTFVADADGEKPKLLDPRPTDEFIKWLHVDQQPFIVNPGEWQTIPVEFTPPADAALSYYYTIIIHRTSESQVLGGETKVSGAPALLVLATVESPLAKRELQLASFRVKQPFLEFLPQDFDIEIKNTGNVHLAPTGNIFIEGQGKKDLAVLTLNPAGGAVLPDSRRHFTVTWSDGFPHYTQNSDNDVVQTKPKLTWDFNNAAHLRFGRYTAHLILVYDNGQRDVPIESSVSFWVIPVRLILAAVAIPVVPMALVYFIMRQRLKKLQKQVTTKV